MAAADLLVPATATAAASSVSSTYSSHANGAATPAAAIPAANATNRSNSSNTSSTTTPGNAAPLSASRPTSFSDLSSSPPDALRPSDQSNLSNLSSSPIVPVSRRFTRDLTSPIPEEAEGDDETESDAPNEPVTPTSGRQSRDFHGLELHNEAHPSSHAQSLSSSLHSEHRLTQGQLDSSKPPLIVQTTATPPSRPRQQSHDLGKSLTNQSTQNDFAIVQDNVEPDVPQSPSTPRRNTRGSASSLSRVRSFFRRSSSNVDKDVDKDVDKTAAMDFRDPSYHAGSETALNTVSRATASNSRRFSFHRSSATTRSNTPPSPGSPLEMAHVTRDNATRPTVPSSEDFLHNKQKARASTGLSFRNRIKFTPDNKVEIKIKDARRTRSMERKRRKPEEVDLTHQPWALAPEAGTGMKARRLSLSLPDDFTVDVAELQKEFEYQSKLLGRHGKHLGKGATSKVTLMVRKGCPTELYAVKEFRGKNSSETTEEYEKKIKSEYSIAKSLHHPNIVETVRLCTDHGRWNHVMEYCSEGDLFSLIKKGHLKEPSRESDRLCLWKQLVQGINYLHSNGIAHRDIKLENLLITKDSKLKITDFGVSEVFTGVHPGLREAGGQCGQGMGEIRMCEPGICGSLPYIAPEVLAKKGPYDPRAADVWSTAVVMINLHFGGCLWDKADRNLPANPGNPGAYGNLEAGWKKFNERKAANPDMPKDAYPHYKPFDLALNPPALRKLLLGMLNPDPNERISISDVVQSRWMKGVECCQMESYEDPSKLIDASKKTSTKSFSKIYCHNHLPPVSTGHGLPPMPGKAGY